MNKTSDTVFFGFEISACVHPGVFAGPPNGVYHHAFRKLLFVLFLLSVAFKLMLTFIPHSI